MGTLILQDLADLLSDYKPNIWAGEVPYEVAQKLRLTHQDVYMNKRALVHILTDHPDIDHWDVLTIPIALRSGLWLQEVDRPNIVLVSHFDNHRGKRFVTAMKTYEHGSEMWVSSYYRSHVRQTAGMLKRCRILRSHV